MNATNEHYFKNKTYLIDNDFQSRTLILINYFILL